MYRYKLIMEYDGTPFSGWQRQISALSVQEVLEDALRRLLRAEIRTYAAGRTDAGVHAIHQVVHFDSEHELDLYKLPSSLNFFMRPRPVCIRHIEAVASDFHARFSANSRSYQYYILNCPYKSVLLHNRAWHVPQPLDIQAIQQAAHFLLGTHDFTSFRSSKCQSASPIKSISNIAVQMLENQILRVQIGAPSFLHNQVRIIVSTLKNVGVGKWNPEYVLYLLKVKNRVYSAATAPACGLYLSNVEY
jgi:tRNA pseudouridine38-40 synthase